MRICALPLFPLFLVSLLLAGCSGGSDSPAPAQYASTIAQMTAFIEKQMADSPTPINSVSIALVDDQQVVWAKGFGYADKENLVAATPDTVYEIGSISKLFGGTMIMQLAEQGKLDLSDPLTRFIPTFSIGQPVGFTVVVPQPVTIRSILTHHSGIPGDIYTWIATLIPDPNMNTKLINYLQGDYLAYPTNFMFDYSDSAVSLLSTVIAAASGETFEAYSDGLFDTLGMDHSSFFRQSPRLAANQARGYSKGAMQPVSYCNATTSGSVLSSVSDMAKFIKLVHADGLGERGSVLNPGTLAAMLTQQNGGMPLDTVAVGLSWFLADPDLAYAGRIAWHNGSMFGFTSHLEILRDHKLGVVVLVNDAAGASVAEAIAKQALKLALEAKAGIAPPSPTVLTYPPPVTWDQAQLDSLQGVYVLSSPDGNGAYMTAVSIAGGLRLTFPASGKTQDVVPRADGWLSKAISPTTEFEFINASGRQVVFQHIGDRKALLGEIYTPAAIPVSWSGRVGTYSATNWEAYIIPTPLALNIDVNGMLIATGGDVGGDPYVIAPVSDTLAYVRGLGRARGVAVKVISVGGHEELQFLGVNYKKD